MRFKPIPLETTFESVRFHDIPTPEPSPKSETVPSSSQATQGQEPQRGANRNRDETPTAPQQQRPRRRWAPQLIDTSRRSRRIGDVAPATKPTDKTDISPWQNHIYVPHSTARPPPAMRRESEDDEVAGHILEQAANEAEAWMRELAMSAFPNAEPREGGVSHFLVREDSDSEDTPAARDLRHGINGPHVGVGGSLARRRRPSRRMIRRKSSEEDVSWATREMQVHADKLERMRQRFQQRDDSVAAGEGQSIGSAELDNIQLDIGPDDALWTTNRRTSSVAHPPPPTSSPLSASPPGGRFGGSDYHMPLIDETLVPKIPPPSPVSRPIGSTDFHMPYIPSAPPGRAGDMGMPYIPTSAAIPPETGFRAAGGGGGYRGGYGGRFGGFGGYGVDRYDDDREYRRMRQAASPPMLGGDLVFPRCPSPRETKLEPEPPEPVSAVTVARSEEPGAGNALFTSRPREESPPPFSRKRVGLWRGYCVANNPDGTAAAGGSVSEKEDGRAATADSGDGSRARPDSSAALRTDDDQQKSSETKQVNGTPAPAIPTDEMIAAEFTDAFVTQVYNYLSLGYPATAWDYDEELSGVSGFSVDELRRDDTTEGGARGHMKVDSSDYADSKQGPGMKPRTELAPDADPASRGPRWEALKKYIYQYAREHPDTTAQPVPWGVRERRGSWAV